MTEDEDFDPEVALRVRASVQVRLRPPVARFRVVDRPDWAALLWSLIGVAHQTREARSFNAFSARRMLPASRYCPLGPPVSLPALGQDAFWRNAHPNLSR